MNEYVIKNNKLLIDRIQEIEIKILYNDSVNKNVEIKDFGILNIIVIE